MRVYTFDLIITSNHHEYLRSMRHQLALVSTGNYPLLHHYITCYIFKNYVKEIKALKCISVDCDNSDYAGVHRLPLELFSVPRFEFVKESHINIGEWSAQISNRSCI